MPQKHSGRITQFFTDRLAADRVTIDAAQTSVSRLPSGVVAPLYHDLTDVGSFANIMEAGR